jgi:hypothetical protein
MVVVRVSGAITPIEVVVDQFGERGLRDRTERQEEDRRARIMSQWTRLWPSGGVGLRSAAGPCGRVGRGSDWRGRVGLRGPDSGRVRAPAFVGDCVSWADRVPPYETAAPFPLGERPRTGQESRAGRCHQRTAPQRASLVGEVNRDPSGRASGAQAYRSLGTRLAAMSLGSSRHGHLNSGSVNSRPRGHGTVGRGARAAGGDLVLCAVSVLCEVRGAFALWPWAAGRDPERR